MYFLVFIISGALIYFTQKIFIHYKKFDDINHRSSHETFATRTGGIGIFATLLVVSSYYYFNKIDLFDYSLFVPLSIMFIVGVYDDFYNADFKLKFLLQIIVAKILIDQGYVIENYHGLFGLFKIPWVLAQLSTVFVFLVIVNAINFIDGIDGLAITGVIKIILIIEFFSNGLTVLAPLGLLMISTLLPLYYFNFKSNTKVFLGDGGSLLLGTLLATYAFHILGSDYVFKDNLIINKTLYTILILIYPLFDLLRVFIIRIKNKQSPFRPDHNHIHHYILSKGFSHFSTNLILLLFNSIILYILLICFIKI